LRFLRPGPTPSKLILGLVAPLIPCTLFSSLMDSHGACNTLITYPILLYLFSFLLLKAVVVSYNCSRSIQPRVASKFLISEYKEMDIYRVEISVKKF
jgi:hypothetical protein